MDDEKWNIIIDRIIQEVLYRIHAAQEKAETVNGTIALISSYVPAYASAIVTLREKYGENIKFLTYGTEFTPGTEWTERVEDLGEDAVLEKAAESENIVLVTPRIGILANIAEGDDIGFVEHLMMRAMLWKRNVGILLDFSAPRFKRNTFYEKLVTILESLKSVGVEVFAYQCAKIREEGALELVTENEILEAYQNKAERIKCASCAIITPSARDKAKELGIGINY
ncbi:MAG: hypothetical protein RR632_01660 [Christensenella sp.]